MHRKPPLHLIWTGGGGRVSEEEPQGGARNRGVEALLAISSRTREVDLTFH